MIRAQRKVFIICLLLSLATFFVYRDLGGHQFLVVDDNTYVSNNSLVQSGLTQESVKWAFTTTRAEFWHPLTWLSYMLDTELFGVNPAGYLLTNLLLHVLNSLLLFLVLNKTTGQVWQSSFVAALFALHPLHVESVAWIAERKDVLSSLFWMLTIGSYAYYVERPRYWRYLAVCLAFALGLMAKPMLVTLPFVLLLIDFWPLKRLQDSLSGKISFLTFFSLIREKLPLFAISAAASALAFLAQKSDSSADSFSAYPMSARMANALLSYVVYIKKMIWPSNLAVFYPFPDHFTIWQVAGSLLGLIAITVLALRTAKRYPYFITGWLWYLGTLVPVIGLVIIGDFAFADRYTYIPLVGLFIVVAWGVPEILAASHFKKKVLVLAAASTLVCLTFATRSQIRHWSNSFALFEHALEVTERNFFSHFALGHLHAGQKKFDQAIFHFAEAVRINPTKATLQNDLGRALAGRGKFKEAELCLLNALRIKPDLLAAHYYLGHVLLAQDKQAEAIYHFAEALRLYSNLCQAPDNVGTSTASAQDEQPFFHLNAEQIDHAIQHFQKLVAEDSHDFCAIRKLAMAYAGKGQYDEALSLLQVDETAEGSTKGLINGFNHWKIIKRLE